MEVVNALRAAVLLVAVAAWLPAAGRPAAAVQAPVVLMSGATWSPDGRRIAFVREVEYGARTRVARVYVAHADGSGYRAIPGRSETVSMLSWAPGGTRIAFVSWTYEGLPELHVVTADGRRRETLAGASEYDWAPSGRQLLASLPWTVTQPTLHVYLVAADLREKRKLVAGRNPAWSPDGRMAAFTNEAEDRCARRIHTIALRGNAVRQVGAVAGTTRDHPIGAHALPSWSSDGKAIAYAEAPCPRRVNDHRPFRAFVVNRDGTAERSIGVGIPTWSPTGDRIATYADSGLSIWRRDGTRITTFARPDSFACSRDAHRLAHERTTCAVSR